MRLHWGYMGVILGLHWGYTGLYSWICNYHIIIGYILGLYRAYVGYNIYIYM